MYPEKTHLAFKVSLIKSFLVCFEEKTGSLAVEIGKLL